MQNDPDPLEDSLVSPTALDVGLAYFLAIVMILHIVQMSCKVQTCWNFYKMLITSLFPVAKNESNKKTTICITIETRYKVRG